MRTLLSFALALLTLAAAPVGRAQTETPTPTVTGTPKNAGDPRIYGEYPLAYRDIVQHWMADRLVDPSSATFEFTSEPTLGELTKKGQRMVGYFVDYKVTARNRFGGRTPKQRYRVLIRNGVVLYGEQPR